MCRIKLGALLQGERSVDCEECGERLFTLSRGQDYDPCRFDGPGHRLVNVLKVQANWQQGKLIENHGCEGA